MPSLDVVRTSQPATAVLATLAGAVLLLSSCARFDESSAAESDWSPAPDLTAEQGPQPELPEGNGDGPPGGQEDGAEEPSEIPPPEGCTDHDPAVIGTCLDTVDAVAALPGGNTPSALAGERKSGTVSRVAEGADADEWTELDVDAAGGGGLTGLALSPSYREDQLVYAYVTTDEDNRVVRFAKGEEPDPVLTGIPKGEENNRGALAVDGSGALLVATGDAGDSAAGDESSLAGKVLRIDTDGEAAEDNPDGSRIIADGLRVPGGVCAARDGSRVWVTDRGADADAVYAVEPGESLRSPAWRWKDKPGVAGCADNGNGVTVAMASDGNLQEIRVDDQGSASGEPAIGFDGADGYGRLSGMDLLGEGVAVVGTVNKNGGDPESSDDRVVVVPLQAASEDGGID